MRATTTVALLAQVLAVQSIRIIQSNDDGWAELYARSFNDALKASGHDVLLSAPAENKSGSGSRDEEPAARKTACQYDSCPANSGPVGLNETQTDLRWVNSYPVTSMRYGIEQFAGEKWNGQAPELAVSGPNVGSNLWLSVLVSGTVGTAVYASGEKAIPAIAFSGASSGVLPWNTTPVPARSRVYGELATRLVNKIVSGGAPYLPEKVWLNVNFPQVTETQCNNPDDFKWVLSRINPGLFSGPDVGTCGSKDRLPEENKVVGTKGCYISISVGDNDKTTAPKEKQQPVLDRLGDFLSCLP
ncbi:5 3 -nucleotidase family protein [Colletotrichum truncatum]|uniref:5 3 -nucleotidase family protein n=1 Tax=Colletotrichum truncatum TaxID=5467 RepID=A0ACC3YNK7_COLTU|nr:5 3 -nucleotidase family protein [Colletotrichum truncatum]KAF6789435.1 5 3 -nucleotidase family protein [Colletotrichum truncatum]